MFVLCLLSSVSFQAVASLLRYAPSACCVLSVCPSVLFPLLLLLPLVMFPFFLSLPFHFFLFLFLSSYALFLFSFLRYRPLCPPSSLALFSRPLLLFPFLTLAYLPICCCRFHGGQGSYCVVRTGGWRGTREGCRMNFFVQYSSFFVLYVLKT